METPDFDSDQVRRAVIQQLQGFRRAGLTHWSRIIPVSAPSTSGSTGPAAAEPRVSRPSLPSDTPDVQRPAVKSPLIKAPPRTPPSLTPSTTNRLVTASSPGVPLEPNRISSVPILSQTLIPGESESSELARKKTLESSLLPIVHAPFQPLNLPRADRITGLAALAEKVKRCIRCQELAATRTQTVFGVGNPEAKIVFIGEAPGADEDAQGEPFVGKSGQLLNDIIKACRLRREDIYICNVLRCRPPGNRLPAPEEALNCREYLDGQLAHVNPEYIVCWGACAAQNLLRSTDAIGKLRKRFYTYGNAKVLCTYHPSYLMRNPAAKKDVWDDMKMLFLDMGIDLTAKK